jgi:uncharacterized repeat protein (TIGR01451 family)
MMTSRTQPGPTGASPSRGHHPSGQNAAGGYPRPLTGTRALCGWTLLLLLGWGSAAPAGATSGTISTPVDGPIIVRAGETLTIVAGGSVTTSAASTVGVAVKDGGTLNITGGSVTSGPGGLGIFLGDADVGATLNMTSGSVHGDFSGLQIYPGSTATISGGSVSGGHLGVNVLGTATISGGSVSGGVYGVEVNGGTVTVSGCTLAVANGVLTGILLDSTPINTPVFGPITLNVQPTLLSITTCAAAQIAVAGTGCQAAVPNFTGGVGANGNCGPVTITQIPAAGTLVGLGPHAITLTATDAAGSSTTCAANFTVMDTTGPVITLIGSSSMTVESQIQGSFADPGATANDACAGSVAVTTSGTVDLTTPGPYTLTYNATDGSNAATPVTRTVTVVPVAELSVTARADLNPVATGSNLTYTIAVQNAGPQPAQGVVLTDPVPAGASFVSATPSPSVGILTTPRGNGSTVTWNIGTLAGGQSVTLTLVVKVSARAGALLSNTATVSSSSPEDPTPGNDSALVTTTVKARR